MQQSIYDPGVVAYGGGAGHTTLHPVVAAAVVIGIILILVLPRKYAAAAFLLVVLLSPPGQQLLLGGVHLYVPSILVLAGLARMAQAKLSSKGEFFAGGFTSIDKVFLYWAIFRAVASVLLNRLDPGAIVYQIGFLWTALGGFFLLRFLIEDEESVVTVIKTFAFFVALVAVTMSYEKFHDLNVFGYLGSTSLYPDIREGSIRARGPFEHEILAGVFGATLVPLFLWLWHSKKSRMVAFIGLIGSTAMVLASASSTSLMTYMGVILGCFFWVFRKHMRTFRWGLVMVLILLQIVMKAPVWFVINHVDLVPGNSSYHRAMLIDVFIRHFWDWWLVGTNDAKNWGWDMWDTSNQFVNEGESGGLATFICFILLISWSFGLLGKARKLVEAEGDRKKEWSLWFLGVALFAHIVGFFGISYFDQTKFMWYSLFAIIIATTVPILGTKTVKEELPDFSLPNPRPRRATPAVPGLARARRTN
jgi:hypothetical protein